MPDPYVTVKMQEVDTFYYRNKFLKQESGKNKF